MTFKKSADTIPSLWANQGDIPLPDRRRGVLLVNLGSPASTSVQDVRRYLREFLMDPYVIDLPWLLRSIVVSGFILPFRPQRTAHAYQRIWEPAGSPLLHHCEGLRAALALRCGLPVELAMRYGEPRIGDALRRLLAAGVDEVLLVALYPHHADSTRTTTIEAVRDQLTRLKPSVRLHVLPPFFDDPGYVGALAGSIERHMPDDSQLLLFSFHGLPERHLIKADPTGSHCLQRPDCCERPSPAHATCYRHQVFTTSKRVASQLQLQPSQWRISFQSRLGRLPWLSPYTDHVLDALPREGITRVTVVCPAFVADNLETLEEIAIAGTARFRAAGGAALTLVPCLNADAEWVDVLTRWCTAAASTDAR
jgi:ferrochelatase